MKKSLIFVVALLTLICVGCGNNKKISCKSDEGSIKLTYNEKTIVAYSAVGYEFDFDGQKTYAEKVGIDSYIDEFEQWFTNNTTNGKCTRS